MEIIPSSPAVFPTHREYSEVRSMHGGQYHDPLKAHTYSMCLCKPGLKWSRNSEVLSFLHSWMKLAASDHTISPHHSCLDIGKSQLLPTLMAENNSPFHISCGIEVEFCLPKAISQHPKRHQGQPIYEADLTVQSHWTFLYSSKLLVRW